VPDDEAPLQGRLLASGRIRDRRDVVALRPLALAPLNALRTQYAWTKDALALERLFRKLRELDLFTPRLFRALEAWAAGLAAAAPSCGLGGVLTASRTARGESALVGFVGALAGSQEARRAFGIEVPRSASVEFWEPNVRGVHCLLTGERPERICRFAALLEAPDGSTRRATSAFPIGTDSPLRVAERIEGRAAKARAARRRKGTSCPSSASTRKSPTSAGSPRTRS
jgi:hypothetical protein